METTPSPLRISLLWTCLAISALVSPSILKAQCDTEVSGVFTYCNAVGTPGTTGYFVAFRVLDLTGDTLNVVDLDGNNVTNRGKRIDDINTQTEPATVTVTPLMISGVGADTLEFWYFGPYANGSTFNIALIDPNGDCDTIYIASGTYDCMDNSGISDPGACDSDVPLYFLDFSQTEFQYGGGGGGNENFDELFLIMQRTRESVCCDLQPANQSCFEFIVRLADQDIGLAIDDVGSGSPGGEIYSDTLNMFTCTGTSATTWPFTQSGGQSQDLPLCLIGQGGQEFVVLSCKSGGNVTGASVDAISNIFAPPVITTEPCNAFLEVFNADTVMWISPDDPNLDNLVSCTNDSIFCTFLYDAAVFGTVNACEGDTFTYIVGSMPGNNECFTADTILYDTTYVVVYPVFFVEIDSMCNATGDSLILFADVSSAAMGCDYAFIWSTGDTTQSITVPFSDTEYFVSVTRGDVSPELQECSIAVDSIIANGDLMVSCENITDTLYQCIDQLPDPDTTLVIISGCANADLLIYVEDNSNGGSGCVGDTLIITRLYIVDFDGDTITTTTDRDTCTQFLSFVDNTPPVITSGCPADVTVSCAPQVPPANPGALTATDNCDNDVEVIHVGDVVSNQTCANRFTITRTYRATDDCGNSTTCAQTITVFDSTPPSITCPMNVTVQCASQVPVPNVATVTATDNCAGTVTVVHSGDVITSMTCTNRFTVTRTYTATDICGNTATCAQIITVFDNTPPTIICPNNVTVQCASQVPAPNVAAVTTSDNCGGTPTVTVAPDVISNQTCANRFTITRVYTSTDACGNTNTCSQIIVVFDNTVPGITCPTNVTVQCASEVPAVNVAAVTTSDNCAGTVTVIHVDDVVTNQSCANRFTITRTYRATDVCGNSATCAQIITVFDNTPPGLTCPGNVTVQCATDVPAPNVASVTTTDNCAGTVTVTHDGDVTSNQTCANRFVVTRTYRATDVCGNSATCTQVITVFDNTPPTITCPANVTFQCASEVPAPETGSIPASDNCGGVVLVGFIGDVITNQTCANRFTITRTYQASDLCGNTATCTQVITVFDNTPPTVTCPPPVTVQCASEVPAPNTGSVTATDNCTGTVIVGFIGDVITNQTCANRFTIIRTYQASDVCGNTATCTQVITVFDDTAPFILCPPPMMVSCANQVPPADPNTVITSDNCGGAPIVTWGGDVTTNQTCVNRYTLQRTYIAMDECGNSSSCSQVIDVFDAIPPMVTCPPNITVFTGADTSPSSTGTPMTTDNCGGTPTAMSNDVIVPGDCPSDFTIIRFWTVTDECGNSSGCTQFIDVDGACNVDLALTKDLDPGQTPVAGGDNITFTITLTNEGLLAVGSVTITDYIPLGFSLNDPDWTAGTAGSTGQSASIVLSTANGDFGPNGLEPTQSVSVQITLQADANIAPGIYENIAEISEVRDVNGNDITNSDVDSDPDTNDANDPPAEDDHDPAAICVLPEPVIIGPEFVCQGDTATYSIENFVDENTYMWVISGGGVIIENNDSNIVVYWTAAPGGPFTISVTEISAPDCQATGTLDVFIQGGEPLACLDHVNISLGNDCGTVVTSSMILTGEQAGSDAYTVYIIDMNGDTVPNATLTFEHVGETFMVWVVSECSGQACMGLITVEDKLPPIIDCVCPLDNEGDSCVISCLQIEDFLDGQIPEELQPTVVDDCGGTTIEITDIVFNFETCEGGYFIITWTATDGAGNTATCVQEFAIEPLTLETLDFPADFFGDCDDSSDPSNTGWPQVDGLDLTNIPSHCNIVATFTDNVFPLCGGGRKIIRTWTVLDWCVPTIVEFTQFIILADDEGPVLTCPADMVVGTDVWFCYANVLVPKPVAIDACSAIKSFHLFSPEGTVVQSGNNFFINELPIGTHTVTWTVFDACHNSSSCSFDITVIDNVPPVMACQQHLVVSLTNDRPNGITLVPADVFDDLSSDNCSPVTLRARRMDSCIDINWTTGGACVDDIPGGNPPINSQDLGTALGVCVPFACCDVGAGPIMIELTATDAAGNVNSCMVEVEVQDKLSPELICPPDISVSCEFEFDVVEGVFSDVGGNNDGSLDEDPLSEIFGNVFDAFRHNMSERGDIIINDPDNIFFPQPHNWGLEGWATDNCEVNLTVTVSEFEDCSGNNLPGDPPPGAVRLITRRFTAVDASGNLSSGTCVQRIWVVDYEPFFITDTTCFNENPFDGVIWPCDVTLNACPEEITGTGEPIILGDECSLVGVAFEDQRFDFADGTCYKILREWSIIDWCQFDVSTGAGIWSYTQTIKVMDTEAPALNDCTATAELCTTDPGVSLPDNNQIFLGENDPNSSSCTVHVSMSQTVTELCSEIVFYDVKFYPFNGDQFIVLKPNTPLLLNANNEGEMSFNTEQSSIPSIAAEGLPYNTPLCTNFHRLVWTVSDGCGNESICDQIFRLEDCKPPVPVCINGLSANMTPDGVTVWASDFNASSVDDCTPSAELLYSFSETSYVPSFTYTCDNIPGEGDTIEVEIWVADAGSDDDCNGQISWDERNIDVCVTYIIITDENDVCDNNGLVLQGDIMTEDVNAISHTAVKLTGPNGSAPQSITQSDGKYTFDDVLPGLDYTIRPERNDNHRNGVSTLDLVRIQKHLLGKELFTSPYQYIAADANNSESVSAIDLVEIRKLILGLYTSLPSNQSWRFVKKDSEMEPDNPWPFEETIELQDLSGDIINDLDFVGIKIGDVNNTVQANALQILPRNAGDVLHVNAAFADEIKSGDIIEVRFDFPSLVSGFQWTLETKGLEYVSVRSKEILIDDDNVGVLDNGLLTMSWNGEPVFPLGLSQRISFTIEFKASEVGSISEMLAMTGAITTAEAYTVDGDIMDVKLVFDEQPLIDFALYQNKPNPWNGHTLIGFDLPKDAQALLTIYDVAGKVLKSVTGEYKQGYNTIIITSRDLPGRGIYYYRLDSGSYSATKKMIIQ